jgi:hypothetical protein
VTVLDWPWLGARRVGAADLPPPGALLQPNGDHLPGRPRPVLAFANVFDFFAHILPTLCAWGLVLGGSLASLSGHAILFLNGRPFRGLHLPYKSFVRSAHTG